MDTWLFEASGIGLVLGLLLGLTGAGGSLVALPLLLSLHLPIRDAVGVSLGAVAMSAVIGVIPRLRQGLIAWQPVLWLALAGFPGSAVGQWLGQYVPEKALVIAFCLLVLWSARRLWLNAALSEPNNNPRPLYWLGFLGFGVGICSGLLGVGGGFLIVPGLLALTRLSVQEAMATSIAVIALVSSSGFLMYFSHAEPSPTLLAGLALGGGTGVLLGTRLSLYLNSQWLQRIFAIMLVIISFVLAGQKLFGIAV